MAWLAERTLQQGFLSANSQNVANTAWVFATLGVQNEALIAGLTERTLQEGFLSTFNPHNVANTAWAFAKLEIHNEALMAGLADRMLQESFLCQWMCTMPCSTPDLS